MATNGTRLLNSILGLEDEEENVNGGGGEQQGVYSNVPRVQAKHSGLHVGNLDNDYTNDEDDKDVGKGTVLADDGKYKSPYETKEGIKQVEEGTRQQEDNTNPDSNNGMENDKVDVTPAKTTEGTGNEQAYNDMYDVIKSLRESADEEEEQSKANEAELKRTAKRRMLLAGIADAANSFHQAYAYARGIKPMNENKGYAKEVRKELREDLDWLRKNKDRVLNYRAKAAEIQRSIAALKNQERQQERLEADAKTRRLVAEAKADYQKSLIAKNEANAAYYAVKANLLEAGWPLDKAIKEAELARKQAQAEQSKASANAANALADQRRNGTVVEEEKTDETGMTTKSTKITKPANASNSNAGTSNRNGGLGWGKDDNKTDW